MSEVEHSLCEVIPDRCSASKPSLTNMNTTINMTYVLYSFPRSRRTISICKRRWEKSFQTSVLTTVPVPFSWMAFTDSRLWKKLVKEGFSSEEKAPWFVSAWFFTVIVGLSLLASYVFSGPLQTRSLNLVSQNVAMWTISRLWCRLCLLLSRKVQIITIPFQRFTILFLCIDIKIEAIFIFESRMYWEISLKEYWILFGLSWALAFVHSIHTFSIFIWAWIDKMRETFCRTRRQMTMHHVDSKTSYCFAKKSRKNLILKRVVRWILHISTDMNSARTRDRFWHNFGQANFFLKRVDFD